MPKLCESSATSAATSATPARSALCAYRATPDDRSVALVDRDDRLIADVIDIGEAGKLPRRQLALRSEVPSAARLCREPAKQRGNPVAVVSVDGPEL